MIFRVLTTDGQNMNAELLDAESIEAAATARPDAIALVNVEAEDANYSRAVEDYTEIATAQRG
jgi:hypothetical protein